MKPEFLKTGDILHCKGHKFISQAIMFATNSDVSHSAIFITIWGQPYVIDAQKNGVNPKPWNQWVEEYQYEYTISRKIHPKINEREFATKALSKVGLTAYDFVSLIIRQPRKIITGKWKDKGEKEEKRMYCSEYAAWCHGIEHSERMSPRDLKEYCEKSKDFITFE